MIIPCLLERYVDRNKKAAKPENPREDAGNYSLAALPFWVRHWARISALESYLIPSNERASLDFLEFNHRYQIDRKF